MSRKNYYDIIIIGAGSVGVPAALAMARRDVKVLVIDKFPSQGQGSNKTAIGGIRATHSDPAKIRICKRTLEIVSTWEKKYGHNIDWKKGGYVFVAYRKKEEKTFKDLLKIQHKYGLNINWYGKNDLLEIIPDLNSEGLIGGTFSPDDGHCSTILAGHAYYDAAKKAGCEFHFNERAEEIEVRNGGISSVKTDKNTYTTDVVLNAAGGWAKAVGKMVGIDIPVNPDSHEGGITEQAAEFLGPRVVAIRPASGSESFYYFQLKSGQIAFCLTPDPRIWGFDRNETSIFLPMVSTRLVGLMPRLSNLRVRRTWRGLYPMTPDGSPLVGWAKKTKGFLLAAGMCGQGFMLGPGLGELLARMVTEDKLNPDDKEVLEVLSPYREFKGGEALK